MTPDITELRKLLEAVREARRAMDTRDGRGFLTRYNALSNAEEELLDVIDGQLGPLLDRYERMEKAIKEARTKLDSVYRGTASDMATQVAHAANILDASLLTPEDNDERGTD